VRAPWLAVRCSSRDAIHPLHAHASVVEMKIWARMKDESIRPLLHTSTDWDFKLARLLRVPTAHAGVVPRRLLYR